VTVRVARGKDPSTDPFPPAYFSEAPSEDQPPKSIRRPTRLPLSCLSRTTTTMSPWSPVGVSLASQIKASRSLYAWVKPFANWYANVAGYRRMGLKYDDLCTFCALFLPMPSGLIQHEFESSG
jgi:hypothetical protein